jgi:hypothetical protein
MVPDAVVVIHGAAGVEDDVVADGHDEHFVTFQGSSPTVLGIGGIASALTANTVGLLPHFEGFASL